MQALRTRPLMRRGGIVYLRAEDIAPNPVQPRSDFDNAAISELAESIKCYGILNPLTVRLRNSQYELVAGERRLRAAKLAGLREVPCIMLDVDLENAGLIALIENLQRKDLDFVEEAIAIHRLIRMFGLSQEECAKRIGKSQSAVANKLRLLKLPQDILDSLRENGLTERHGRALLRLNSENEQRAALKYMIENALTVAAADSYIDSLLTKKESEEKVEAKRTFVMKDVRIFLNSISHSLEVMKRGGIDAGMKREDTEDSVIVTISIPKPRKET